MAAKAFFTVALLIAAAIGFALPTPTPAHQPQSTQSSFETIALNKG